MRTTISLLLFPGPRRVVRLQRRRTKKIFMPNNSESDTLLRARPASEYYKVDPIAQTIFARNKLMPGGVLGLSFGGGYGSPPLAIPALESALGSHPCGALSSVQVPSL